MHCAERLAMPSPQTEFFSGIKAELPILLGVIPLGMIYGALAVQAGLPAVVALAASSIVLAGSAQFIAVRLVGLGAPAAVILLTTLIVNLRHLLYSASVGPHLRHLRRVWKWLLAYLLTDEAYAVAITHYVGTREQGNKGTRTRMTEIVPDNKHWYFLGAGLALWSAWQASTATGILLGAQIPTSWSLEFALPLTFIALVVPTLTDRAAAAAALSAGVTAVLALHLPFRLGLLLAAFVGILVGVWMEHV